MTKEKFLKAVQNAWCRYLRVSNCGFLFIPLIIAGGRLVARIIMNTWDMLES